MESPRTGIAAGDATACRDCAIMRAKGLSGFDVALHHIESSILSGVYVAGMQLPPEREMAAQLSVGRGAVREAIRVLQAQGIVVSGTGPGNGTRIRTTPGDALGKMLRLHLALDSTSVSDLTQTRMVLERAAVEAAAGRGPSSALARAKVLLERMEVYGDATDFNEMDTAFHIAIVEAGGNHMLTMICSAIRQALAQPIHVAETKLEDWRAFRAALVDEHHAILAAIETGDAQQAGWLAEDHIRRAHSRLLPGTGTRTPLSPVAPHR